MILQACGNANDTKEEKALLPLFFSITHASPWRKSVEGANSLGANPCTHHRELSLRTSCQHSGAGRQHSIANAQLTDLLVQP